ncbi:MAG: hypothetical protein ACHBN1_28745 [Heteroscytonema crispum UTEX LB 1556]
MAKFALSHSCAAYTLTDNAQGQAAKLAYCHENFLEVIIQTCLKFMSIEAQIVPRKSLK